MLGPVDMDDWRDGEEMLDLLRGHPQIEKLRGNARLATLPGWSRHDFRLARRLADGETLGEYEIQRLSQLLGA
jgi:hypothetical protein